MIFTYFMKGKKGLLFVRHDATTFLFLSSSSALATLTLQDNNIGDEGAQYLAHALQENTVKRLAHTLITRSRFSFHTDAHKTISCE